MSQGVGLASCLPKTAWPPTSPQLSTCVTCHADAKDFDINGTLTAIEEQLAELKTELQAAGLIDADGAVIPGTWSEAQATALWNYGVIEEDASGGAHNPTSRIVAMSFCEPRSWTRLLSS